MIVPLVLPPVVGGVALLTAFGRSGLVGGPLYDAFGVSLPFTTAAVVLAHTFVALPFFVLASRARCAPPTRSTTSSRPRSARAGGRPSAGSRCRWRCPGCSPGWCSAGPGRSGEFGATITFAGNYPGTTQTMPHAIYVALQTDQDAALVLSVILMLVSVAVLALLRDRWFDQAVQGPVRREPRTSTRTSSSAGPGTRSTCASTAERGDVVAVIGPNGAGKSTLVRALAGLVPLDDGPGRSATARPGTATATRAETRRRDVGMVFQKDLLFPHLTRARQRRLRPAQPRRRPPRTPRSAARAWLDRLGVGDLADRRPAQLSGGQAQRVAIARALATEPAAAAARRAARRPRRRGRDGAAARAGPAPRGLRRRRRCWSPTTPSTR